MGLERIIKAFPNHLLLTVLLGERLFTNGKRSRQLSIVSWEWTSQRICPKVKQFFLSERKKREEKKKPRAKSQTLQASLNMSNVKLHDRRSKEEDQVLEVITRTTWIYLALLIPTVWHGSGGVMIWDWVPCSRRVDHELLNITYVS